MTKKAPFAIFFGVAVLFSVLLLSHLTTAKRLQDTATINVIERPGHPLKIVSIKYGDKLVQDQAPFEVATNDWLKDITVTMQSVSTKPITYFDVACNFPLTSDNKSIPPVKLISGKNTALPNSIKQTEEPIYLTEGQQFTLKLRNSGLSNCN